MHHYRHEFAPHLVPQDIENFLRQEENQKHMPGFYEFYQKYCVSTPDYPIVREIDGEQYDFARVSTAQMTRARLGRVAIVLREAAGGHHRLFTRPFKKNVVTEYVVSQAHYRLGEHRTHLAHSMLYLAEPVDGGHSGLLEVGGEYHQLSVWATRGNEFLLEPIPRIVPPTGKPMAS